MTLVDNMLSVHYHPQQLPRSNVIVANTSSSESKAQQKRKMYAQSTPSSSQPASVARRNARERNRVKQVNNGFATLRQHIPQTLAQALGNSTEGTQGGARAGSKKLSKVETLRMAVEYIRNLQALIDEHDSDVSSQSSTSSGASSIGSPAQSSLGSPTLEQYQHQHHQPEIIKFEIKTESCEDQHQYGLHYQQPGQQQQHHTVYHQLGHASPVYVAEPSNSPTPSFVSDSSSTGGSQGYGSYSNPNPNYSYEGYEPMSPEDAVLLDYLSYHWQPPVEEQP